MFISIAGNIGLGKSTLAEIIAKEWGFKFEPEKIGDQNPFLVPFYVDIENGVKPSKNAYDLQMFFLGHRVKDHKRMQNSGKWWVQDRSIYEDPMVYAMHLNVEGFLSNDDYEGYLEAFDEATKDLKYPDLLVHLLAPVDTARERIKIRGRSEEMHLVDSENLYLDYLHNLYDDFLTGYHGNSLVINVDRHNIKDNRDEREIVLSLIRKNTPGLNRDDLLVNNG